MVVCKYTPMSASATACKGIPLHQPMACKRAVLDQHSGSSSDESLLNEVGLYVRAKRRPCTPVRRRWTADGRWRLAHQLRAHSIDNNPRDTRTVVWRAEVEPDVPGARSSERGTAMVVGLKGGLHLPSLAARQRLLCATVGGESVCLIDGETGRVEMKYKEPGETLWCCCWATLDFLRGCTNVLAVGGAYLHLLNPREKVCFHHLQPHPHGRVMAVQFHPKLPAIVVTASDDKADAVAFHHIGSPVDTSYRVESRKLLSLPAGGGVQHMQVSPCGCWVAATCQGQQGTLDGLSLWRIDTEGLQLAVHRKRPTRFVATVACQGGRGVDPSDCGLFAFMAPQELLVCMDGAMKVLRFDTTQKDGTSVKFTCISTLDGPKSEDLSWVWPTYSPDTGLWCFADDSGDIWLYDLRGEPAQRTPPVAHVKGVGLGVNQVVLAQRWLVAACDSNIIQIWQQQTGEVR